MRSLIAVLVVVISSAAFAQRGSDPLLKKESVALPSAEPLSRSKASPAAPNLKWSDPRQTELMAHEKRRAMIRMLEELIELESRGSRSTGPGML
jgi:hypothetical protein